MVDGIDGSGKSTVIATWKKQLAQDGNAIFDLKAYWLKTGRYPELSELKGYDFIFTAEPTFVGIGRVIRDELIKNGTGYPPRAVAEAYALDRLVLYKKIIIPLLAEKKCVIQDRGISTSLCYQSISGALPLKNLLSLAGNALALRYRPDHLTLLQLDPTQARERLRGRLKKQDNVIFERLRFQTKAAARFASKKYQTLFTSRGTHIHQLPAGEKLATMRGQAEKLLHQLLA